MYREGKEQLESRPHVSNMVEAVSWYGHAWLPKETGSQVYLDDVTAEVPR